MVTTQSRGALSRKFVNQARRRGIRFIKSLLGQPPAIALQLDDFAEELYSDDVTGTPIEDLIPDYSILTKYWPELRLQRARVSFVGLNLTSRAGILVLSSAEVSV